ncbi:MAG: hypothetical protein K2O89_05910 [Clostridia bacterium]|nr:hypothetical protein [Clostridia bacterium]
MANKELIDITTVEITANTVPERLASFIKTVKNPYCFRVKQTPVKIVFSDKANAPAVENLLVNIATRRFD